MSVIWQDTYEAKFGRKDYPTYFLQEVQDTLTDRGLSAQTL